MLADRADCQHLVRQAPAGFDTCVATTPESLDNIISEGIDLLVYEPGMNALHDRRLRNAIASRRLRLMLRFRANSAVVEEAANLIADFPRAAVVLHRRHHNDNSARVLYEAVLEPDGGPVGMMFNGLPRFAQPGAAMLVLAALALGRECTNIPMLADELGVATRTCQVRALTCGLPSPYRLLCWGRAAWAVWRIVRWGYSRKMAAVAGGFPSGTALSSLVRKSGLYHSAKTVLEISPEEIAMQFHDELLSRSRYLATDQPRVSTA